MLPRKSNSKEADQDQHTKHYPLELLSKISISDTSAMPLIGHSVIRFINPRRRASQYENLLKLFVPGMAICATGQLEPQLSTSYVNFQVGVNSCPSGPISEAEWLDLIVLCRQGFPQASLRLSSIILAQGRHNLNNAIVLSNRHLQSACSDAGVEFIDNQSTLRPCLELPDSHFT